MIEQDSEPRDSRFNNVPIIWLLLREVNCMAGILFMRESPNPLENFIKQLGMSGSEDDLELTGKDIADILWFGLKLQEFGFDSKKSEVEEDNQTDNRIDSSDAEDKKTETSSSQNTPVDTSDSVKTPQESRTDRIPDLPPPKAPVYSSPTSYSQKDNFGGSSGNLSIKIPDPPSLRDPLDLIKSLRLLMQRVPSGRKGKLDEEATVKRIVDEQIWTPVLEDELEPWLDLALVIDESSSMLIWSHYIEDLKRLFKQYGIFRELTIWGIKLEKTKGENQKNQEKLQFIARNGSSSRNAQPEELLDATRRRLILIASDCVSDLWRKGIIFPTLQTWTAQQQVAILQMLPRVMWRKSALGLGMLVNFSSSRLGVANQELFTSKMPPFLEEDIRLTQIPILSLEKEPTFEIETENRQRLFKWTEMLLGKRDSLVSGYLLPPELHVEDFPALEEEQKAIDNQDAEQRIARFRRMTSPMGRKLAGLLAAAPVIRLPIVRLIQESMLPQSDRTQIAEVFLGGLLKPKAGFEIDINTDPETVEYEFIDPEIRDIFVEEAPISDSVDIVNSVSRYIAEQMGVSMSNFMAMLKGRQKADNEQQENTIKPFAEVTARVLRKLGGEYVKLANELISSPNEPIPPISSEETITLIKNLTSHLDSVRAIAFTPDGKYLVSSSNDCSVRIWDWTTGQLVNVFKSHEARVKCIQVSKDSRQIISASADNTIKIWDLENWQCIRTIITSDNPKTIIEAIALNSSQNLIFTGSSSGNIKIWNWHTGRRIDVVKAAYSQICSLAISSDGNILASGSGGGNIKIWHLDNGLQKPHHVLSNAHMSDVLSLAIQNQTLVSGGKDNTIKIWDLTLVENQPNRILYGHKGSIRDIAISPDGNKIASASMDSTINIWDLETGEILKTLTEHSGGVRAVAFSPNGNVLASGAADNSIKIWNTLLSKNDKFDDSISKDLLEQRILLGQYNKTKLYSLLTNEPWKIPFDAFVISTSMNANFTGSLAKSFSDFIGENNFDELRQAKNIALSQSNRREITPEYPLIFPLPASIDSLLNFKDNEQEHFIICSTVEFPKAKIKNVAIAVEATIRLIAERKFKRVVLTLFGTGNNSLPIFSIAEIMLSKFAEILTSLSSHSIEQITLVGKSESTIAAINQVAGKFQNQTVDYTRLRSLLANENWIEADKETVSLMLFASGKEKEGSLTLEELTNFSCQELQTIDRLWLEHSNGRFGFSIQKNLYENYGGTSIYNNKVWRSFGQYIGWRKDKKWLSHEELDLNNVKFTIGYFPYSRWILSKLGILRVESPDKWHFHCLTNRLAECEAENDPRNLEPITTRKIYNLLPLNVKVAKIIFNKQRETFQQIYVYRTSEFNKQIKKHAEISSRINRLCQQLEEMNENDALTRFNRVKTVYPYHIRKEGNFRLIARTFSVENRNVLCLLRIFNRQDREYENFLSDSEDFFDASLEENLIKELRQWLQKKESKLSIIEQTQKIYHFVEDLQGMNHVPLQMIQIPDGRFIMGSPASETDSENNERPQHLVEVPSFFMGRYPITNAQWNFVVNLPQEQRKLYSKEIQGQENHPVTNVSWYDAIEFCARLSRHTNKNYRLPSESEWEYACRAINMVNNEELTLDQWNTQYKEPFHFGETISTKLANYNGDYTYGKGELGEYRKDTTPVDFFSFANNFGLSDMHGNVWEWCADPLHDSYNSAPNDSRVWDEQKNENYYQNISENLAELLRNDRARILRGGSWYYAPKYCRSAYRNSRSNPDGAYDNNGFRVVMSGEKTP